jgi:type II secretory pathway component PulK
MANTQEPYDCLSQSWAGGPGNTNGINPILDQINLTNNAWGEGTVLGFLFPHESPGDKVRCSIQIVDLERKFNINRAAEDNIGRWPLENTFKQMEVDIALIPYLVDAIKDWRDPDDDRRISGVENEYYEPLGYTAKNGPIDDLQELLLIRNITPKMYWGNRANQLANTSLTASQAATEEDEEPDYPIGLVDLYTPISVGYININTASMEVLQLLPGMDVNRAAYIIDLRDGIDNVEGTYDDVPFTNIQEIRNVPGFQSPEAIANAQRFLSVRSATFEVTVTAEMHDQQRTLVAVLSRRNPTDVKILYTFWK